MKLFKRDNLLKNALVVFVGMMGVHLCNMGYQMVVSRVLPQSEYTWLAAFLGALAMVQYPLNTVNTGMAHYCSLLQSEGRGGDVRRLLGKWSVLNLVPALLLTVFIVSLHRPLTAFLHMDRSAPVLITGLMMPALFLLPVLTGATNGLQMFGTGLIASIVGAFVRVASCSFFVFALFPACGWALLGHMAGLYCSALILLLVLFRTTKGLFSEQRPLPSMRLYLSKSFLVQTGYAVLMSVDVIVVKHFFPEEADFAYAATMGRLVVFLGGAVAVVMFPKVSSTGKWSNEHQSLFLRSLFYTFCCAGVAALGCCVLPGIPLRILFGISDPGEHLIWLMRLMSSAMFFNALLNVSVQFMLAQRRFMLGMVTVFGSAVYLLLIALFHSSPGQVAMWSLLCNASCFFLLLASVFLLGCGRSGAAS